MEGTQPNCSPIYKQMQTAKGKNGSDAKPNHKQVKSCFISALDKNELVLPIIKHMITK